MAVFQVACSAFFMFSILNTVQSDSYKEIQIADNIVKPGVFKYQDNYYMVGRNQSEHFMLKSSKDLLTWKIESYSLLGDDGYPKWADRKFKLNSPEIHVVQNKFNLYFFAENSDKNGYSIGVATADTLLGPYMDVGGPLLANDDSNNAWPNIAREGTYKYKYKCIIKNNYIV